MRKFERALCVLFLLCLVGITTTGARNMPFYESASWSRSTPYGAIHARLAGGLIVVQASFNGIAGNYIIDTGASHLFINQELVADKATSAYGLNAQVAVEKGKVTRFSIGREVFEDQPFYKMDMRHLEALKGCQIAGIIGTSLLKNFTLFVDYHRGVVRLEKPRTAEKKTIQTSLRNFKFSWQEHFPMLTVTVNAVDYAFAIDTGAEANIFSGNHAGSLAGYTKDITDATIWTIGAATTPVRNFTLTEMECLNLKYPSLGFMFSDLAPLNTAYSVQLDGILGYPFLRRHPFTLDFTQERLIIWQ